MKILGVKLNVDSRWNRVSETAYRTPSRNNTSFYCFLLTLENTNDVQNIVHNMWTYDAGEMLKFTVIDTFVSFSLDVLIFKKIV